MRTQFRLTLDSELGSSLGPMRPYVISLGILLLTSQVSNGAGYNIHWSIDGPICGSSGTATLDDFFESSSPCFFEEIFYYSDNRCNAHRHQTSNGPNLGVSGRLSLRPGSYDFSAILQVNASLIDTNKTTDSGNCGIFPVFNFDGATNVSVTRASFTSTIAISSDYQGLISSAVNTLPNAGNDERGFIALAAPFDLDDGGLESASGDCFYHYDNPPGYLPVFAGIALIDASVSLRHKGSPEGSAGASAQMDCQWFVTDPVTMYLTMRPPPTLSTPTQDGSEATPYLPMTATAASNSIMPVYCFTNAPSGFWFATPPGVALNYGFAIRCGSNSSLQTIELPHGWTNSLSISSSGTQYGDFQAGQTVSFASAPGGSVSEVFLLGHGFPLAASSNGNFPVTLGFTTSNANFTLRPLTLRVDIPYADQILMTDQYLLMQAAVRNELPCTYQWQMGDQNLPGQTNAILLVDPVAAAQAGRYRLVMTTSDGINTNVWYGNEANVQIVSPVSLSLAQTNSTTNRAINLEIDGQAGVSFFLEQSSDLVNWQAVSTNTLPGSGSLSVDVPTDGGPTASFFRTEIPTTLTF